MVLEINTQEAEERREVGQFNLFPDLLFPLSSQSPSQTLFTLGQHVAYSVQGYLAFCPSFASAAFTADARDRQSCQSGFTIVPGHCICNFSRRAAFAAVHYPPSPTEVGRALSILLVSSSVDIAAAKCIRCSLHAVLRLLPMKFDDTPGFRQPATIAIATGIVPINTKHARTITSNNSSCSPTAAATVATPAILLCYRNGINSHAVTATSPSAGSP